MCIYIYSYIQVCIHTESMWFIHLCKHILYSITFISFICLDIKKIMRCRTIRTCASLLTAKNINRNGYVWFPLRNQVTWKNPFNRQPFGKYTAENQSTIVISQNNFSGVVSKGPVKFNRKSLRFYSKTNIFFWCFTNQEQCWTYNVVSIYQLVGGFSPFEKYYSKWVHLPQFSGWKWKKIFELPPPRSRIHIWMKYFALHQPQGKSRWLSSNLPGSDIHHLLHGVSREIDFCCPPNT